MQGTIVSDAKVATQIMESAATKATLLLKVFLQTLNLLEAFALTSKVLIKC